MVILKLIRNIAGDNGTSNSIDELVDSAKKVGLDRLEQHRKWITKEP
jgi:hypothetical protein